MTSNHLPYCTQSRTSAHDPIVLRHAVPRFNILPTARVFHIQKNVASITICILNLQPSPDSSKVVSGGCRSLWEKLSENDSPGVYFLGVIMTVSLVSELAAQILMFIPDKKIHSNHVLMYLISHYARYPYLTDLDTLIMLTFHHIIGKWWVCDL